MSERKLRLRHVARNVVERGRADRPLPHVTLEDVESGTGRLRSDYERAAKPGDESVIAFRPGDVLFGKLRPYLEKSLLCNDEGYCSPELLVLRPLAGISSRYLAYIVRSATFVSWAVASSEGVKMPRTAWEELGEFRLPLTDLDTQERTADFLDTETKRLDAVLESKSRLRALLHLRRQAVVVAGVTGKLPSEHSGHETTKPSSEHPWLGAFPSGWPVKRLRFLVGAVDAGDWGSEPTGANDVGVIRAADFDRSRLRVDPAGIPIRHVDASKVRSLLLRRGDLVLEKSGGGEEAPVGLAVLFDLELPAVPSNFAARLRPRPGVTASYLRYVLAALYFLGINTRSIKQTTGIQNLDVHALLDEPWAVPNLDTQSRIVAAIERELSTIDRLDDLLAEQVTKLAEYRRALITESVTGRLPVPAAV